MSSTLMLLISYTVRLSSNSSTIPLSCNSAVLISFMRASRATLGYRPVSSSTLFPHLSPLTQPISILRYIFYNVLRWPFRDIFRLEIFFFLKWRLLSLNNAIVLVSLSESQLLLFLAGLSKESSHRPDLLMSPTCTSSYTHAVLPPWTEWYSVVCEIGQLTHW